MLKSALLALVLFPLTMTMGSPQNTIPAPSDVAKAPKDAKTTSSGLASKVITPGTGKEHPKASSTVTVNYTGWTTDGKMFDSSVTRGKPISFPLNGVIKGWTEGVQLMVVGEKRRFWIPADLAYGENPRPGYPKGMLVFDIELLSIQ
jgi:peptidylprolyl isomerase